MCHTFYFMHSRETPNKCKHKKINSVLKLRIHMIEHTGDLFEYIIVHINKAFTLSIYMKKYFVKLFSKKIKKCRCVFKLFPKLLASEKYFSHCIYCSINCHGTNNSTGCNSYRISAVSFQMSP